MNIYAHIICLVSQLCFAVCCSSWPLDIPSKIKLFTLHIFKTKCKIYFHFF